MSLLFKLAADDTAMKLIFDHIRNLGICAVVGAAAVWKAQNLPPGYLRYHELAIAVMLGLFALWLFYLNQAHAYKKLRASGVSIRAISLGGLAYSVGAVSIIFSLLKVS